MADKKPQAQGEEKTEERAAKAEEAKGAARAEERVKGAVIFTRAVPATIEEVIGRTGERGEAVQIRCKILDGRDANKVIRRNVKGPVKIGDILMLRETEIEARPLTKKGRGTGV